MKVEFLGTGGALTTPRPGCLCRVCVEARKRGLPYSRSGPSLFVHGPDVVIDTPEEIKDQLNRSRVREIKACFYSHWHPDHSDHPILRVEATFAETLQILDALAAERVVMTHIEEMDGLSYDDLRMLGQKLQDQGRNIVFAYDTMLIDV